MVTFNAGTPQSDQTGNQPSEGYKSDICTLSYITSATYLRGSNSEHLFSKRFVHEHIGFAKRFFRTGDDTGVEPLHRHMAYIGWQGFRIFPLEKIQGVFPDDKAGRAKFRQSAFPRETFWKRVLHAFMPTGLCLEGKKPKRVRTAHPLRPSSTTGAPSTVAYEFPRLTEHINSRTFASRVYERKVRFLLHGSTTGRFDPAQIGTHSARNVRRMYDCLHEYNPDYWGVGKEHFDNVNMALFQYLSPKKQTEKCQTVIVQLFLHRDLEQLGINTVVADEEAWNSLVPRTTREKLIRPVLAYKYAAPISRSFCNYAKVSSITLAEKNKVLNQPCQCKNPSFRAFQDKHTGHVITTDTSIMRNARLQNLMAKGTKFRCTVAKSDLEEECGLKEAVLFDLKRALNTWMRGVKTQFGEADGSAVQNWKDFVLSRSRDLVRENDLDNATTAPDLLPSENDLKQLHYLHEHFVITTVDKAENNFCIMCKKFYLQQCLQELEHGVAYRATDRTENEILRSCQNYDDTFRRSTDESGGVITPDNDVTNIKLGKIPNFHIRVKMHKSPIGFRFVAGSRDAPLTNVSKWLTLVLKALLPVCNAMWSSWASKVPGAKPTDLRSWIINDSEGVSQLCRSVNKSRGLRAPLPLAAYDFTTMYTTLCLSDLKSRMASLIESVFQFKNMSSRAKILLVDKYGHHEWIANCRSGLPTTSAMFDQKKIIEAISFLVDNTYVRFAGTIWHQIIGIPMGTNCAGFLANLYCFTYELDFLKRTVNEKCWTLALETLRSKRYIDDLIMINCVQLPQRLYLPEGIYPKDILSLVLAAEGETVPYMDLLIRQNRRRGLITAIYDKRLDDKYANINVIRYPDRESVLANKAKSGIVTSQMYRFHRRCTLASDFVYNTSLVLHRLVLKAYHTPMLWAQVRRFLLRHPDIYGRKTVKTWCDRIRAKMRDLSSGVCRPGPMGQVTTPPKHTQV